jgi:hypothetical protein
MSVGSSSALVSYSRALRRVQVGSNEAMLARLAQPEVRARIRTEIAEHGLNISVDFSVNWTSLNCLFPS